jgi:hypothetical protein
MEMIMSSTAPLTPPPRTAALTSPSLPQPHAAKPGAAGEQFRKLLEPKSGPPAALSDPRADVPTPQSAAAPAAKPEATADAKTLREALAAHSPRTAASASDADVPRSSGAQVRQQQQWAQAQRDTAADSPAAPPVNVQAFDGATPHVASAAAPPEAAAAAAPRGASDDFVALLLDHCSQMYVAQSGDANNARMLLDLGQTLPGSLVELAREGAFLRVRLHAADPQAGQLMDAQRERLVAALERSTRLGVVVDVVRTR